MSLKKMLNLLESPLMRGVEPRGQESWDEGEASEALAPGTKFKGYQNYNNQDM